MIKVKRVYEAASRSDGKRFLVDRLWPRGIKKEGLMLKAWLKDVAPSDELRHWYSHDPAKWKEFRKRYFGELKAKPEALEPLLEAAPQGDLTLLYSARVTELNNAVALKEYLESELKKRAARRA
jgi:uncharacterized protein YeaO (DUF488 family)